MGRYAKGAQVLQGFQGKKMTIQAVRTSTVLSSLNAGPSLRWDKLRQGFKSLKIPAFAGMTLVSILCNLSYAAPVAVIKINGGINPASNDYIKMSIKEAHEKKAECLVIQLDTPGGLLSSTRDIVQAILEAPLPIVVYVSPQGAHAGSAGVMITLSAHVAAMAPGTNIGAAHPVTGTGQDVEGEMKQKVTNDAAAFAESIAKTRGRNTKWAIEAVRKSVSITAEDALEKNVIDVMAPNLQKLLEAIHGRSIKVSDKTVKLNTKNAETLTLEMSLKQKIVDTLSDPNIAYLLMAVGGIGIYFELTHPGLVAPGVVGGICLILGFISMQTLPINYGGLLLLLLGLLLLIAEIFVPSFGVLGIGGLIAMVLGAIFFIDPSHPGDIAISLKLVIPTIIGLGMLMLCVVFFVVKAQRRGDAIGGKSLVGKKGYVVEDIIPPHKGRVFVDGTYWTAESNEPIKKDEDIIVENFESLKLIKVRKDKEE